MTLAAHFWTVWPLVKNRLRSGPPPDAEDWHYDIHDPDVGPVRLTGHLRVPAATKGLAVLVHGLGGSAASLYLARAAWAADQLGLATLRLNLRGSDRSGVDLYHAGLTSDLAAALTSPRLAFAEKIYIVGYSLGGHVALKFATEAIDSRLQAVAAICSPLDLDLTVRAFDQPSRLPYRRYVLSGLFEIYDQVARVRPLPVPPEVVRRAGSLREFDRLAIVPRFGFDSVEDYYRRAGVGSRLDQLRVPSLLVAAKGDPMVAAESIHSALAIETKEASKLDVRWTSRGGHVSFPADLDLGLEAPLGLEHQVLAWLLGCSEPAHSSAPAQVAVRGLASSPHLLHDEESIPAMEQDAREIPS